MNNNFREGRVGKYMDTLGRWSVLFPTVVFGRSVSALFVRERGTGRLVLDDRCFLD